MLVEGRPRARGSAEGHVASNDEIVVLILSFESEQPALNGYQMMASRLE